jgi:hypothetical protein
MTVTKNIEALLVVNWKTGACRIFRRKPNKNYSGFDIPIRIKLKLVVPEFKEIAATGTVEIPESRATEMMIEAI